MNDKIRALQREHEEKYQKADELLSKESPTDSEQSEAAQIIDDLKSIKVQIDKEFTLADSRHALGAIKGDRDSLDRNFALSGKVPGRDGAFHGMKEAGSTVIDSFGSVMSESGPGTFGEKTWDLMQSPEYKMGFFSYLRRKGNLDRLPGLQAKVLQEGLDDQGGVFVPADMLMRIIGRLPTPTRLAGLCTNLTTGRDRVIMPRKQYSADDLYSTAFRATWTGEIPATTTIADVTDTNLLGNVEIPVFTAMMTCSLTNDMVEDSAFPIQQWIENELRIVVELLRDNMILNGTGKGQPTGILQAGVHRPTLLTSTTAAGFSADDVLAAAYAIPEQYDENCTWGFNKTSTAAYIAVLKDLNDRYLFGAGTQDSGIATARPQTLVGYPYAYSGFFPNIAASALVAVFGDWRGHYVVSRLGITIQVLRETRARLNQFELVARVRFGGQTVEPWRLRILQCGP